MKRIAVVLLVSVALTCCVGWYLRPILVWHFTVEPGLEAHVNASRLHVETLTDFMAPSPDWSRMTVANLSILAPIASDQISLCEMCVDHCVLAIESGTLAVFRNTPDESFEASIALWAPGADAISWHRSRSHNWRVVQSLIDRVDSKIDPPRSFRFRTQASKGVVTISEAGDRVRLIIYAYALDGTPTRLIGLTGTAVDPLYQALGSLEVRSVPRGEARDEAGCATATVGRNPAPRPPVLSTARNRISSAACRSRKTRASC